MSSNRTITGSDITLFLTAFGTKLAVHDSAVAYIDRKLSTKFNPLELLLPGEVGITALLRELLDPNGTHGQGPKFLLSFLKMLDLPTPSEPQDAKVFAEHYTRHASVIGRRIDLLVSYDDYAIAIENKLGASDQKNQVRDYLEVVRAIGLTGAWVVYLTPNGAPPSEWSISSQEFGAAEESIKLLAYTNDKGVNLVSWLRECRQVCESQYVSGFLNSLEQYLTVRTQGMKFPHAI